MGGIVENVQRKIFFHRAVEGCGGNVEKKVKNYFLYPGAAGRLSFYCCAGLLISATSRLILSLLSPPR